MTELKNIPIEKGDKVWIVNVADNKVTEAIIVHQTTKTKKDNLRDNMYLTFLAFGILSFGLGLIVNYKKFNGN